MPVEPAPLPHPAGPVLHHPPAHHPLHDAEPGRGAADGGRRDGRRAGRVRHRADEGRRRHRPGWDYPAAALWADQPGQGHCLPDAGAGRVGARVDQHELHLLRAGHGGQSLEHGDEFRLHLGRHRADSHSHSGRRKPVAYDQDYHEAPAPDGPLRRQRQPHDDVYAPVLRVYRLHHARGPGRVLDCPERLCRRAGVPHGQFLQQEAGGRGERPL